MECRWRTGHMLDARWRPGVFLGVERLTNETIARDEHGAFYAVQGVSRVNESSRCDKDLFLSVKGTLWQYSAQVARERMEGPEERCVIAPEIPRPVTVMPERLDVTEEAPNVFVREEQERRVYSHEEVVGNVRLRKSMLCMRGYPHWTSRAR